jgi:hypothetical protein
MADKQHLEEGDGTAEEGHSVGCGPGQGEHQLTYDEGHGPHGQQVDEGAADEQPQHLGRLDKVAKEDDQYVDVTKRKMPKKSMQSL